MSKVWVFQKKHDLDFTPAAKYGELRFLFRRGFYPDDVSDYRRFVERKCDLMLKEFNPLTDYVIPIGCLNTILCMSFHMSKRGITKFRSLKWDSMHGAYYEVQIGD
tara:strand:+ start:141 stop:458 length:318 start_codon:yes stop_codon:yes gene_type:complete